MRDKQYPNRTIRLSDEVWESLKVAQKESGKSWNLFIKELNKIEEKWIQSLNIFLKIALMIAIIIIMAIRRQKNTIQPDKLKESNDQFPDSICPIPYRMFTIACRMI